MKENISLRGVRYLNVGMKYRVEEVLFITSILDMVISGSSLQCWKCIAHDCEADPEDNYKASKVKCNDGDRCMKVRYRMFDNVTHYDSVIRTCTSTPCDSTSVEDFSECVATPKLYMIGGCTLRSCCDDRNLCNSSVKLGKSSFDMYRSIVCVVTFFLVTLR